MWILRYICFIGSFISLAFSPAGPIDSPWVLKKDKDGIKVFIRNKPGSSLKDIRVISTLESTMGGVVHMLTSKEDYKTWIYACSESYLVKEVGFLETYHYQVTAAPWPVEDRDLVLHTIVRQDEKTGIVDMVVKNATGVLPEYKGKVRVPYYDARWIIRPVENNMIEVDYTISLDPGGNIPVWVINMAISDGPLKTMQNFRTRLELYKDVRLPMILEKGSQ